MCNEVEYPREICNKLPQEVCEDKLINTVSEFKTEEVCKYVPSHKCLPISIQECSEDVEEVPQLTYETICNTNYVEECY